MSDMASWLSDRWSAGSTLTRSGLVVAGLLLWPVALLFLAIVFARGVVAAVDRGGRFTSGAHWAIAAVVVLGLAVVVGVVSIRVPAPADPAGGAPTPPTAAVPSADGTAGAAATPTPAATPGPSPAPTPTRVPAGTPAPPPTPVPMGYAPLGATETATVLRVIDGDTIEVDRGRGPEKVRYIGVDTPETVDPDRPIGWMGPEASLANRDLVEGREVFLERDVSETDRYGRLLRYVWVEDPSTASGWLLVNLALVAQGFAQVSTYPPDVRYVELYLAEQEKARTAGLGLWGTPPTPTGTPQPIATPQPQGKCDRSYPGVCIPPPPPDLDCGDITQRRFEVLQPDPHRFDGDGDGLGCEGG